MFTSEKICHRKEISPRDTKYFALIDSRIDLIADSDKSLGGYFSSTRLPNKNFLIFYISKGIASIKSIFVLRTVIQSFILLEASEINQF